MLCKLSKVAYLDSKRKNRDINVVEQINIPYFRKLNDIGIPLRLFQSFFIDVLVDMIVG